MIRYIFLFSIFLSVFTLNAGPKKLDIKIFTGKSKKTDFSKERSFIRAIDFLTSRILPKKRSEKISYNIVIIEKKEFTKPQILTKGENTLRIYLPEDTSIWNNNYEFFSNIIGSVMLIKTGTSNGENYKVIPNWLKYAVVAKILRRNNTHIIPGSVSFPGVHALILSDDKTDWFKFISNPMKPEDGPAFKLFLEASEIILDGILKLPEGKEAIIDIIELSNKELNPESLFKGVIIKKLDMLKGFRKVDIFSSKNPDIVKGWLDYIFRLSSVNVLNPCNASIAEKLFIENQIVKYYTKTNKDNEPPKEERYCKIEEIPDKINEIYDIKSLILQKQRELLRITFNMPLPLQDPLYKIEHSLDLILYKDYNGFKKEFTKQKQIFYDKLEKQYKVEVYILKTEKTYLPYGYRYCRELEILKDIKIQQRKRWPELNEYLDTFSNQK